MSSFRAHRGWFAMKNWRLEVKPVHLYDTPQLGVALFRLEYRGDQSTPAR